MTRKQCIDSIRKIAKKEEKYRDVLELAAELLVYDAQEAGSLKRAVEYYKKKACLTNDSK